MDFKNFMHQEELERRIRELKEKLEYNCLSNDYKKTLEDSIEFLEKLNDAFYLIN